MVLLKQSYRSAGTSGHAVILLSLSGKPNSKACGMSNELECSIVQQQAQVLKCLLAEHGEVGLADDKGEEEVDADGDGLPSSSGLNVVELRGHQPPQGAPGPGKPSSVQALEGQNGGCRLLGDVTCDLVKAAAHDTRHNNEADEHLEATLSKQHLTAQPVKTSCLVSRERCEYTVWPKQGKAVTGMLALHRLQCKS